jgi:hypothetical protein
LQLCSGEISLLIRTYKIFDTALQNNQEQITLQEIEIAKNDARIRKGFITNGRS